MNGVGGLDRPVLVRSKKLGSKKIAEFRRLRCCEVLAGFKSPHEERFAVVTLAAEAGFEASIVCDVNVFGAHMTRGFKK